MYKTVISAPTATREPPHAERNVFPGLPPCRRAGADVPNWGRIGRDAGHGTGRAIGNSRATGRLPCNLRKSQLHIWYATVRRQLASPDTPQGTSHTAPSSAHASLPLSLIHSTSRSAGCSPAVFQGTRTRGAIGAPSAPCCCGGALPTCLPSRQTCKPAPWG